ncbi:polysaccharide biosynthesis/export family protein [Sediminicola luteus]|uniref:Sugar transporter n=1 Tax=Sediminicola luteus TaxID=319238 RepID=A0A2A4G0V3_9FLAO|nr:polysaccharide biosynthesis/export family protein [Sediminicola luteus]PCE62619.1 sugar transporter [Sediminicola luteus]
MNRKNILPLVIFTLLLIGCASKEEVVYFQDAKDYETLVNDTQYDYKFKIDDVLSIHISTLDPQASVPFNLFRGAQEGDIRPEQVDYIIDKEGNIDFPVLGSLKMVGLSPSEAKELLRNRLEDYLKDPIINIRLKNFSVTVLGEVNRPGTYPVNGEQITILEAIGMANDLTIKGMRTNVLVIRDFNGTKAYYRIDLTSKECLESPVYYLTQNDVVYIEPNNSAITSSSLDNRATIAVSIASLLITSTVLILTR